MHGYELNATLESRDVHDWAAVSRPQVYYSLRKLAEAGAIVPVAPGAPAQGPERQTYRPTAAGRRALREALARPDWAERRPPPAFLTWLALAHDARPADVRRQIERRRRFLETQVARERTTLQAIEDEVGPASAAALMVGLTIRQFEVELGWLRELPRLLLGGGAEGR